MYYGVDENGLHEVKCVSSLTAEAAVRGAMYDAHELCEGALHGEDRMNKNNLSFLSMIFSSMGRGCRSSMRCPSITRSSFWILVWTYRKTMFVGGFPPLHLKGSPAP